jgi:hypothetical protein
MAPELMSEDKAPIGSKAENKQQEKKHAPGSAPDVPALTSLQQRIGNRAVQRILAQRAGDGSFELDDATAARIKGMRGGGQALEPNIAKSLGSAMGADFGGVRVHTSPEADHLSRELGARAFTTGKDIFGREGALNPHTSEGQKTTAHELTHVEQQRSGVGGGVGRMRVGAVGDAYEQEADSIASSVVGSGLQMQVGPEEEEEGPTPVGPEEEEEGPTPVGPEEEEEGPTPVGPEEEEEIRTQVGPEEEEEIRTQVGPEEEEKQEPVETPVEEEEVLQTKAEEEEEPGEEEEELIQPKREEEGMEAVGA